MNTILDRLDDIESKIKDIQNQINGNYKYSAKNKSAGSVYKSEIQSDVNKLKKVVGVE